MAEYLGVAGRAVVHRFDGRVLLVRRTLDASVDPGMWELPGGKMEAGEGLVDALAREVSEETGLAIIPGDVVCVDHRTVGPFWVTVVTYDCGETDLDVALSDEHSEHAWVRMDGLGARLLVEGTREQLDAWSRCRETRRGGRQ